MSPVGLNADQFDGGWPGTTGITTSSWYSIFLWIAVMSAFRV
jgi:hypothetical protein